MYLAIKKSVNKDSLGVKEDYLMKSFEFQTDAVKWLINQYDDIQDSDWGELYTFFTQMENEDALFQGVENKYILYRIIQASDDVFKFGKSENIYKLKSGEIKYKKFEESY